MGRPFRYLVLTIVIATAAAPGTGVSAEAPILDLAKLLDDYSAGRFDQAVAAVQSAGDSQATLLRTQWRGAGRLWIDADPATKPQRLLAAASFALETERLRVERGAWMTAMAGVCPADPREPESKNPAGPCVLEWGWSLLVERAIPDAAERAWVLAASALVGGVRDFRVLYRPAPGTQFEGRGLIAAALARHPGDTSLRLEQAIALAGRFNVTTESGGPAPSPPVVIINYGGQGRGLGLGPNRGRGPSPELGPRPDSREGVVAQFTALVDDPRVGPEAEMRLGYLLWANGEIEKARQALKHAAVATKHPDIQYLALFLCGWFSMKAGWPTDAIADFQAALEVRPDSQSAALALASLEMQRGEAARADDLARVTLSSRPDDADPWRMFLYGHYPQLLSLITELRSHVKP